MANKKSVFNYRICQRISYSIIIYSIDMSTQEKARELWTTYRFALSIKNAPLGEQKDLIAKQCALIVVDEIIQAIRYTDAKSDLGYVGYWQQVKTEIEKL